MSATPESIARATSTCAGAPQKAQLPWVAKLLFRMLAKATHGALTVRLPGGATRTFTGSVRGETAELAIRDWRALRLMLRSGDIGIAEAWRDGWIDVNDMTAFLKWCIANQEALASAFYGGRFTALLYRVLHALRPNTRSGARKNIHAHYDLGNDFYRLWLDPSMTYSSALFEGDPTRDLSEAQAAKYDRILREAQVQPGQHILEIGCGWGGLAEYAARTYGCHVTGVTISQAQLDYARVRIANAGLSDRVTLKFCDYRDIQGQYDAVVSIEMIEAVGEKFWPSYFATVYERLKPGGRAVIQGITIDDRAFATYRQTSDFIREYIFPGGMLASPERFQQEAEQAGLNWESAYAFGRDYAETLRRWRAAFERESLAIARMGFDSKFQLIWRFYLHYCEAGFDTARTDVLHMRLARPN
jgi:cyclopropane-fatty-acyl-phospholipid synthase